MVGLATFLALVVGATAWLTLRTPTYHAPLSGPTAPQASPARAALLLHDLTDAVRRDRPAAAARLASSAAARRSLRGVVRNGTRLHVSGLSLRYVDEVGGVSAGGGFAADVQAAWRFAGFDRRPEQVQVRFRFAEHDGRLGIAGVGGGGRRTPLWLTGPLQVRRTASSLVLVQGSHREADRFAGLARTAVPQVRAVLQHWTGGLVLEVPATQQGLEQALDAHPGQYDSIAAVTTTVNGSRSRSAPVHVFVNPAVFGPLKPHGAQVVVTHEATHVATGAATSPAPIWLVEGFADYVALRAQRLPLATTASRIASLVHRQGPPARLPGQAEFAAGASHLEARYESAWLACRLLARLGGPDALVSFYRAVDAGRPLGPELRHHFGFGLAALTARWRTVLSHLPA
ncbi:hypothetical protein [Nocardioides cynanchi]|uniref:hypothetical protein n=1 Tax=Nocardioides cynanchi TaxID=2558918 RepID=UPI001248F3EC|nr:hypothetical protein [Nocardioides cynanchi]